MLPLFNCALKICHVLLEWANVNLVMEKITLVLIIDKDILFSENSCFIVLSLTIKSHVATWLNKEDLHCSGGFFTAVGKSQISWLLHQSVQLCKNAYYGHVRIRLNNYVRFYQIIISNSCLIK